MEFALSEEQQAIRAAIARICAQFDADYWLAKDRAGEFPHELHQTLARDGWLGIAMPEAYGGAGLGITEAAVMLQTIAESGAGFSGASAVHMNIFGLNPVVVFGTDAQKRRVVAKAGPVLRAVAQDERSQLRNRELAVERLVELLRRALWVERKRVATRPTRAARERRLDEKRRQGAKKRLRRPPPDV